jgi:hypothetical protein
MTKKAIPLRSPATRRLEFDEDGGTPEPSSLYSLQPVGACTPYAESIDSYAFRLTERHRIARCVLDELARDRLSAAAIGFDKVGTVDAPTKRGRDYARALADLTGVPAVAELGLHAYAGVLCRYRALKPIRAWCGQCFSQSRAAGDPAAWPLLWALSTTEICLKHDVYLQTQCLKCGCSFSSDTQWRGPLDMCPHCGCDLAGASAEQMEHANFRSKERTEFATFDRVAVELSAELVSSTGRVLRENLPLKIDLQQLVDRVESLKIADTATALGRLAGLQKSTMHDLYHGNGGANLPNLTRLAIVAQVSLAGVMAPPLWRVNPQNASWNLQLPRPKRRCLRDWVRIRAEIAGLAAGPDVTSPSAVAKQLNIDPRLFRQRIGGLATEMRERSELQRARRFEEQVAQFTLRIIEQRNVLQRSVQRPSCRRIAEAIRLPRSSKVFKASWERSLKMTEQPPEK